MKFAFFNSGSYYLFNPKKEVYDPNSNVKRTLLDIHKDLVLRFDSPDCFILNEFGRPL